MTDLPRDNVTALRGEYVPGAIDDDVVAELRRLLDEAERGEVVAIAATYVRPNDVVGTTWTGICGTRNHLIAGVGALQNRMLHVMAYGAED